MSNVVIHNPKKQSMHAGYCELCGELVLHSNNNPEIMATVFNDPVYTFLYKPQHFLPTENCPGTPENSQYIEGQPEHIAEEAKYDEFYEKKFREAYANLNQP
jgi:hypothetical protein